MKKCLAIAVSTILVGTLALPVAVSAKPDTKTTISTIKSVNHTKQAYIRGDISIVLGDKEVHFKKSSGKAVYPIIYQNRTYLPLRAIGELMGKNVNWDANTKTITIAGNRTSTSSNKANSDIGKQSIMVEERADFTIVVGDTVQHFTTASGATLNPLLYEGSTYLPLRAISDIMGSDIQWDSKNLKITISADGLVTDADSFKPDGSQQYITREKAKEIALDDAGKKPSEVTFVTAKMETENGKVVYDIEFYSGKTEYDYEIDATNGKILSKDLDIENFTIDGGQLYITREKAKEIALDDAGKKPSEVTFVTAKMETENGKVVYDIEFYSGKTEYDYEIDATNGKILSKDLDIEDFTIDGSQQYITREKAKEIALDDAGKKASEVTFITAKMETENGKVVYDIEFYSGKTEYDYEIDATNGKILSKDWDVEDFVIDPTPAPNPDQNTGSKVTLEQAKNIALQHAGVSASEVIFTKAKIDYDDGLQKYELEFRKGKMEYECEVDAKTGNILEYDAEYDD